MRPGLIFAMASASHSGSAFKKSLMPWSKLDVELSEKTMRVLFNSGFRKMTPVQVSRILYDSDTLSVTCRPHSPQSSVIPLLLRNKDVAVEAVSGAGLCCM